MRLENNAGIGCLLDPGCNVSEIDVSDYILAMYQVVDDYQH